MSDSNWLTSSQWQLGEYALAYMSEFNSLRSELQHFGTPASLYSKELVTATIFVANDGIAIVYVDEETRTKGQQYPDEVPKGVEFCDVTGILQILALKESDHAYLPPISPR
jgi:hypothetical protein